MNRDLVRLVGLAAIGVLAIVALWQWSGRSEADSAQQETVITELTEAAEATPADETTTIAPPQPEATADFPAVTTDAVRAEPDRETPLPLSFTIIDELPHDTAAFTQGLEVSNGRLFESTGLFDQSSIREIDLGSGEVIRRTEVPEVFAEGLTVVGDSIIQITWQAGVAYRRDLETFEIIETYTYEGQGWGICDLDDELVMSNGTSTIEFRDPATFEVTSSVDVTFSGEPISQINELECVNGSVWANIWQTSLIIEIDPATGEVIGVLDATALTPVGFEDNSSAVLNGIAYDPSDGAYLLTGKLWPTIYRVRIQPATQ